MRTKLSKRLFMTLKEGQYIMDNRLPLKYEKITNDHETQWSAWRGYNGSMVTIYDSKSECLRDWWRINSVDTLKARGRVVYRGKLSKRLFMDIPVGRCLLFTQMPMNYIVVSDDRKTQWNAIKS